MSEFEFYEYFLVYELKVNSIRYISEDRTKEEIRERKKDRWRIYIFAVPTTKSNYDHYTVVRTAVGEVKVGVVSTPCLLSGVGVSKVTPQVAAVGGPGHTGNTH